MDIDDRASFQILLKTSYNDFLCCWCHYICIDPFRIPTCGHLICFKCFSLMLIQSGPACPTCHKSFDFNKVVEASDVRKNINSLQVVCPFRNQYITFEFYKVHIENCKCSTLKKQANEGGIQCDSIGSMTTWHCPYSQQGCEFQAFQQPHLDEHMKENTVVHLELLRKSCSLLEDRIGVLTNLTVKFTEQTTEIVNRSQLLINAKYIEGMQLLLAKTRDDFSKLSQQRDYATAIAELRDSVDKIDGSFTGNLAGSFGDQIQSLQTSTFQLDQRLLANEQKLQDMSPSPMDGVLIWQVKRFSTKMEAAKNDIQRAFYSEPFYTEKYGYKLYARLYPNGDGVGRNSYMSIFFGILSDEYDFIKKWPFSRKVTFTLLDQTNKQVHIRDSFIPDPENPSFQRPKTEMNVACGIPLFVTHKALYSGCYLIKDTLYLKVEVGT